jgi:predicted nucleic acid-binding protein
VLVVLDACVLYPPSLRDLLLTLASLDAFDVRWSEEILDELRRNVLADYPDIAPDRFDGHTLGAMRSAFPDALVTGFEPWIEELDNDPKDRHVAAVAMVAGAQAIVTLNVADFRSAVLTSAGIRVVTPGTLLDELLDTEPGLPAAAIGDLAARWVRPTRTVDEILDLLAQHATMAGPIERLRTLMA